MRDVIDISSPQNYDRVWKPKRACTFDRASIPNSFFLRLGCDSPFWCGNDAARAKFDGGAIEPEELGLSPQTSEMVRALAAWHDTALNWDYLPDPSPWRQDECDRFNAAVDSLLETIRTELSEEYELIDQQWRAREDPDLDRYLADPKGFRR